MVFTETSLDVEVNLPSEGYPLQKNVVEIKVTDRFLNQPASVYGILEVFDNRVASKSPREPLVSALGDSYRNLSNYLVSWRDWTGIDKGRKMVFVLDQVTSFVLGEGSAKAMMAAPQPSLIGRKLRFQESMFLRKPSARVKKGGILWSFSHRSRWKS